MATESSPEEVAAIGSTSRSVRITENYSDYIPPFQIEPIIRRMLDSIPEKYLVALSEVVLTNLSGLSRKRRRSVTTSRKRKVHIDRARGMYHPAWNGKQAWIEIFVDNSLRSWERGIWLKFRFVREVALEDVLFHEVGHHIHYTARPEFREREDVADVWKVRLQRGYYAKRYPLLRMLVRGLKIPFGKFIDSLTNTSLRNQLRKKWISRAEFDERMKD